ncbi:nucleophile aminohydrolase [Lophiotrema nucula]|uniref:Nucleophile aminohydrolase n=1 Tax=Lophiotrema nucula TaxID=690887 RepID=A0A6A5ZDZ7_9PLEO|nr:nucleophile aminohydrolase [Lophiotrema nucula]
MASQSPQPRITPRIIIHGGAGNITQTTVPRDRYDAYEASLRRILASSAKELAKPGATALDVATHAVTLLENDPLYNSGHGAVFTLDGSNELECSIMVSNPQLYKKRGVGLMLLKHVKNPIKLAREILIRGNEEDGGGLKDHCQYSGEYVESLAKEWGIEMVDPSYFWTKKKWEEHKRGLKEDEDKKKRARELQAAGRSNEAIQVATGLSDWEKNNYIPLGTCGAVVLDSFGFICTATSTGGLTNKIPGRVGDTPTMGAGYWAEEFFSPLGIVHPPPPQMLYQPSTISSPLDKMSRGNITGLLSECFPTGTTVPNSPPAADEKTPPRATECVIRHAVGTSSSGNGDSFVRLAAATTTASYAHFTPATFSKAMTWMTGPNGELQKSAGDRWGKVHEGTGGMIGIETVGTKGEVVCDYNCGGMFRAWIEEDGKQKCLIFRKEGWESGPKGWEEGMGL